MKSRIESTYDSTPAAMVARVEAGIAILKPPAVGEEISWISLAIVRCGGLIWYEEIFLVINWHDHDTTNDDCLYKGRNIILCSMLYRGSERLEATKRGKSLERVILAYAGHSGILGSGRSK